MIISGSEQAQNLLKVGNFDQGEGKDASNYTYIAQYTLDESTRSSANEYLIAVSQNGQKTVNSLKVLAQSRYPAGGKSLQLLQF